MRTHRQLLAAAEKESSKTEGAESNHRGLRDDVETEGLKSLIVSAFHPQRINQLLLKNRSSAGVTTDLIIRDDERLTTSIIVMLEDIFPARCSGIPGMDARLSGRNKQFSAPEARGLFIVKRRILKSRLLTVMLSPCEPVVNFAIWNSCSFIRLCSTSQEVLAI